MTIHDLRADTPGCLHRNHLNNAGSALPPLPVLRAMQEHLDLEAQIGGYEAMDAKAADMAGFYESIARLIGAQPHNIAFAASATDACARALSAIAWQPGDVILTTENDYVSSQIAFLSLQQRHGVRLVRARDAEMGLPAEAPTGAKAGGVDVADFERLAQLLRPKLAVVTHVPTNSGLVQPVEAIGLICRELGIWYLVDACQSAGQIALDVERIGCDFLTVSMRKFLRGPRGAGFLFASDRVLEADLQMLLPDMRSARWTAPDTYLTEASAKRFEYMEIPPALLLGSRAAAEYAMMVGMDWIEARTSHLAALTRSLLAELPGVQVLDRGAELSGIATTHAEHWTAQAVLKKLYASNINCRVSPLLVAQIDFPRKGVDWALRISPHYYNTEEEIQQCVGVLAEGVIA